MKGIIYVMTTAVKGLIKIGQTETKNYKERMRNLKNNGYFNVSGLKEFFAIEVEDYKEKEKMLHDIFEKHKVDKSELFALDMELVKQLLLSFDGKIIYPENIDKEDEFEKISEKRKPKFTFLKYDINIGEKLYFYNNENIVAEVVENNKIKWNDETISLSDSAQKILDRKHQPAGTKYWKYKGKTLDERRIRMDEENK